MSHLQWHLKATATRAYHLFLERSCTGLILMGEKQVLSSQEEFLHKTLRANIISRIDASPAADPRDRRELIETALRDHKSAREAKAIEDLAQYKPEEQVFFGLRDVIEVFNSFLVRELVIGESLRQNGYVCKAHHYLSLEETGCPFCGAKFLPVESIVNEIIEIAYLHGVSLTVVEHREDLLARYEGIAAVTYPHLAHA
jgi:peptide subunit release factor 1 (eRF1)